MNYQPGTEESMEALMIEIRAQEAKQDQLSAIKTAKSAFESYWAGSASASVFHHAKRGAVKVVYAE